MQMNSDVDVDYVRCRVTNRCVLSLEYTWRILTMANAGCRYSTKILLAIFECAK